MLLDQRERHLGLWLLALAELSPCPYGCMVSLFCKVEVGRSLVFLQLLELVRFVVNSAHRKIRTVLVLLEVVMMLAEEALSPHPNPSFVQDDIMSVISITFDLLKLPDASFLLIRVEISKHCLRFLGHQLALYEFGLNR